MTLIDDLYSMTWCWTLTGLIFRHLTASFYGEWIGRFTVQIDVYPNVNVWMWHHGHTLEANLKASVFRLVFNVWTSAWTHDVILHRKLWYHAFKTHVNVGSYTSLLCTYQPYLSHPDRTHIILQRSMINRAWIGIGFLTGGRWAGVFKRQGMGRGLQGQRRGRGIQITRL